MDHFSFMNQLKKMFLNGKNSASVLYGKDFFIIIFNFCLLLLTLHDIKSGENPTV